MRRTIITAVVLCLLSCNSNSTSGSDSADSVSTDSLENPSFNPKPEADSAAKQMNLDSTSLKTEPDN